MFTQLLKKKMSARATQKREKARKYIITNIIILILFLRSHTHTHTYYDRYYYINMRLILLLLLFYYIYSGIFIYYLVILLIILNCYTKISEHICVHNINFGLTSRDRNVTYAFHDREFLRKEREPYVRK